MMYIPTYFKAIEIFPPSVIAKYPKMVIWQFMDAKVLETIDTIRECLGRRIFINGYNPLRHKTYHYRGYRPNTYYYGILNCSQHYHGRALDFDVEGMTAQEVRDWLVTNQEKLPYPIWVEETKDGELIDWIHIDVRQSQSLKKVYLFAA